MRQSLKPQVMTQLADRNEFPTLFMKLYTYQLCRSLAYIHSLGVCHRDIKPQNLLVHPETHLLKLCDFGISRRVRPPDQRDSHLLPARDGALGGSRKEGAAAAPEARSTRRDLCGALRHATPAAAGAPWLAQPSFSRVLQAWASAL